MNTPVDPKTELKRAYLMIEWGRLDDALAACDAASAVTSDPMPDALAGSFLSAFGHHTEAIRRIKKALRVDPAHSFANAAFAEACLCLGRRRQAAAALKRITSPDDTMRVWITQLADLANELADMQAIVVGR